MVNIEKSVIKFDTLPSNVEVYIDGETVGITPLDITDVDSGAHQYTLKRSEDDQFHGTLYTYPRKITQIKMDFNTNSKTEKYVSILSAQEQACSSPSVNMIIPENETCSPPSVNMIIPENETCSPPSVNMIIPEEQTTQPQIEQPQSPSKQVPSEQPPAGQETPSQTTSMNDILGELQKTNETLNSILQDMESRSKPRTSSIYDNETTITTAVSNDPHDPLSSVYQLEKINDMIGHNAEIVHVYNYGPGLLYVVTSINGTDFTKETLILEGEKADYTNIHTLGLRSPTALLKYRVTEREITNQASQQFTGSRFIERRDRKGVILFQDDIESPTLKFQSSAVVPGFVRRSTDIAYNGDFSIITVTPALIPGIPIFSSAASSLVYTHPDFHISKVGAQVRSTLGPGGSPSLSAIQILYFDGTNVHSGLVVVNNSGNVFILESDGVTFTQVATKAPTKDNFRAWNTFKLSVNITSDFYSNISINGLIIDVSSHKLQVASSITTFDNFTAIGNVGIFLEVHIVTKGDVATVYYDNYILTEDEQ